MPAPSLPPDQQCTVSGGLASCVPAAVPRSRACRPTRTLCPSGLRGWTQVPLARAAWAQIPQVSSLQRPCGQQRRTVARVAKGFCGCRRPVCHQTSSASVQVASLSRAPVAIRRSRAYRPTRTLCPSGLRGWTPVPLAQAAWAQIPQLSFHVSMSSAKLW